MQQLKNDEAFVAFERVQKSYDGETLVVKIGDARTCVWDFRYEFSDKDSYEEYEINICDIDGESFTIH